MKNKICITKSDYKRLAHLISQYKKEKKIDPVVKDLLEGINRAKKVDSSSIPPDYVTMNSVLELQNLGRPHSLQFRLVFPNDEDPEKNSISVLSPLGSAVLGFRQGDVVKWKHPAGENYFKINRIRYQPEANGDYHL